MGLKDIESTLPPGFRFHPSDEELVCHYLYKKVANESVPKGTMMEVDLHLREPWELPEVAKLSSNEWYFFSFRSRKYATGSRANRATKTGYWKATGKDRTVYNPETKVTTGMRKTLVFYRGRAPNGMKSGWVMHEFRLESPDTPPKEEEWVLCRVFHKRKAESEQANPTNSYSSALCSSPAHKYQPMPAAFYDEQLSTPFEPNKAFQDDNSNTMLNLALMQCNYLGLRNEVENNPTLGEKYGFLFERGLQGPVGGWSFPNWEG